MHVITARNVHEAFPLALQLIEQEGVRRDSRNGPVLLGPSVTTVYLKPLERVMFWPQRDANPFYHLYESLWMLAGRNDINHLAKYAKNVVNFSDDGKTWHGAYGHRWRRWPANYPQVSLGGSFDQLPIIAAKLRQNPDDRRCVLSMWDTTRDLGRVGKDLPCNVIATFQRGIEGELNLVVFCRSNDIIWGCYGANAVHFSFLLEYMALWIGCAVGTYTQISVNWHAYLSNFDTVKDIRPDRAGFVANPYSARDCSISRPVHVTPMAGDGDISRIDELIETLLEDADDGFTSSGNSGPDEPWARVVYTMLKAHHAYRHAEGLDRYRIALDILSEADQMNDWIVAGSQWMTRRFLNWQAKQGLLGGELSHP